MEKTWDCIVVGAGAAGLSAALVLGRARRATLVIDAGRQSNLPAHGIGGLLGHDTRPPAAYYAAGREDIARYPSVALRSGTVVGGRRDASGFTLELAGGEQEAAKRVLLATGMDYRHPPLPGIAERWGRSAFHCPFCHGWEVRDQVLGVLDRGARGAQRALLLRMWSDDVTLLADGPAELDAADAESLRTAGVAVDERQVAGLEGPAPELESVAFADGSRRSCSGLLVPVSLHQRTDLAVRLGADVQEPGHVAFDPLAVDGRFATGVPGLFAAGDATAQMPSVVNAIATGSTAAAMVVQSLMAEAHAPAPAGATAGGR